MRKAEKLALEILLDSGLVEKHGSGYMFTGKLKPSNSSQESGNMVVSEFSVELVPTERTIPKWLFAIGKSNGDGTYFPKNPVDRVLCAYKIALGILFDDRGWDKAQYSRYLRPAQRLLDAFDGDDEKASYWLQDFAREMKDAGLNWTLDTASRRAWDTVGARESGGKS